MNHWSLITPFSPLHYFPFFGQNWLKWYASSPYVCHRLFSYCSLSIYGSRERKWLHLYMGIVKRVFRPHTRTAPYPVLFTLVHLLSMVKKAYCGKLYFISYIFEHSVLKCGKWKAKTLTLYIPYTPYTYTPYTPTGFTPVVSNKLMYF